MQKLQKCNHDRESLKYKSLKLKFLKYIKKTIATAMASCGHNGDNETKIGMSQTISISFSEASGKQVPIYNSSQLIDIWIPRDLNAPTPVPQYVNISIPVNNRLAGQLFPLGFNVSASNSSIHLEFAPENTSVGYLILLKFNMTPRINLTFSDYDSWKMFCPTTGLINLFIQSLF
jgi:hypothetical protein